MLSTDAFATWSKQVVLFLHNTSHVEDEPYPELLFEKGGNGFPTVSFLAADGRLMTQVGHVTPVEQLDAALEQLNAYAALRDAVTGPDHVRFAELVELELESGYIGFADAEKKAAAVEWPADRRDWVATQLINLQFRDILRSTPRDQKAAGGKRFVAMLDQDRVPASSPQLTSFWEYMFTYAGEQRDIDLFERLLAEARRRHPDDRRLQRYLPMLERQLGQLKRAAGGR